MSINKQPDDTPDESIAGAKAVASEQDSDQSLLTPQERRPLGSLQHFFGGGCIVGSIILTILLWFLFRPAGQPTGRYLGEIVGVVALVLFSCSLLLATRAPFLERFFGGLDIIVRVAPLVRRDGRCAALASLSSGHIRTRSYS